MCVYYVTAHIVFLKYNKAAHNNQYFNISSDALIICSNVQLLGAYTPAPKIDVSSIVWMIFTYDFSSTLGVLMCGLE